MELVESSSGGRPRARPRRPQEVLSPVRRDVAHRTWTVTTPRTTSMTNTTTMMRIMLLLIGSLRRARRRGSMRGSVPAFRQNHTPSIHVAGGGRLSRASVAVRT